MKKYEGALASSELPCVVPNNINADPAVTIAPSTESSQINCATGFIGSINYKCSNGVFSVTTNSCSATSYCNVPNNLNTIEDGARVSFTLSQTSLTCKSGYSGNVTYTCDANGVFASSGTCDEASCSLSGTITAEYYETQDITYDGETGEEYYNCLPTPQTFNLPSSDAETVLPSSTWKIKNIYIPGYYRFAIRYNCSLINNIYTLRVELKTGCYLYGNHYNLGECFIYSGKNRMCFNFKSYLADSNCQANLPPDCESRWILN